MVRRLCLKHFKFCCVDFYCLPNFTAITRLEIGNVKVHESISVLLAKVEWKKEID